MICRVALLLLLSLAPAAAQPPPEAASGRTAQAAVTTEREMVVAAHPAATAAGAAVLAAGGHAVDALVAVQMALNVVEPQSSGIGGGAFIVLYDAASRRVTTIDGRETAPAAARPTRFLDADGRPLAFADARRGGRAVGVPGVVAALGLLHDRHGRRPWADLFAPAIALAEEGFPVSPRLHHLLSRAERLGDFPAARALFLDAEGRPPALGTILRNPALAETFRTLAEGGPAAFYNGAIADAIAAAVAAGGGDLTRDDLADYRAVERPPVCRPWRDVTVCGMGPPSSGGLTVLEILGLLAHTDFAARAPDSPGAWHLILQASRLAFADRNQYIADSDFVPVPVNSLLDPAYLAERARAIGPADMGTASAGDPGFAWPWAPDPSPGAPGTSHVSIVDADGNAVAMTTTIESAFGSHLVAGGFLLNNELTDFAFMPVADGRPVANRVEPGKRPRSSMAPTLVLRDGRPVLVTGSPGGSSIIGYVVKTLVAVLAWEMTPQQAADLANVVNRNGDTVIEPVADALAEALAARGHPVRRRAMTSGVHTIAIGADGLTSGVDPRREGAAAGR